MLIYKATNTITGECYVGKTNKTLAKRKSDHKYEAFKRNRQSKFYKALREYGWEQFRWEVLYIANNNKNLKIKERHYIINCNAIDYGYNSQIR